MKKFFLYYDGASAFTAKCHQFLAEQECCVKINVPNTNVEIIEQLETGSKPTAQSSINGNNFELYNALVLVQAGYQVLAVKGLRKYVKEVHDNLKFVEKKSLTYGKDVYGRKKIWDLIAIKGSEILYIECKTQKKKGSLEEKLYFTVKSIEKIEKES